MKRSRLVFTLMFGLLYGCGSQQAGDDGPTGSGGSIVWAGSGGAAAPTAGASGSGNGTVSYSVAKNSGAARSGTLTIAGQTFKVNQRRGK